MDRSRKRSHYYDHQDYEAFEALGRTKPRYHHNTHGGGHHYNRRGGGGGGGGGGSRSGKVQQDPPPPPPPPPPSSSSATVSTSYKILCRDDKAGGVIGKSGSIIKAIRQHTGAWINVQELVPGDDERVIEITDTRRRDPEGRMPVFSPAQEALIMIHERVLQSDSEFVIGSAAGGSGDDDYPPPGPSSRGGGGGGGGGGSRVATRLVVSRMHVGSLLGKGGKIIEQMRGETKTQIRVLPRDHNLPRCVASSEEIVQVVGDATAVKKAVDIISSRLKESQHRDRGHFHSRLQSSDQSFSPDDDFPPHLMNNTSRRSTNEGPSFGSQLSSGLTNMKSNDYASRSSGYALESRATPGADGVQPFCGEDLVFRILCPYEKVHSVIGDPDGIADLLRNEIGVDVHLEDLSHSSNEQIIVISSEEGPDDELFPAQEALLHIQTRIVDLVPDGENIVTTRLLVSSSEVGCFEGRWLSDMKRVTGANVLILTREEVPGCITGTDEIVQITGEIKAARDALVEVTSRLRSHLYRELFSKETLLGSQGNTLGVEINYPNKVTPASEVYSGRDPPTATYHNVAPHPLKDSGSSGGMAAKQKDIERREEDMPSGLSRQISVPLVTRSILEVVIPENAVPKLITKSKNRLIQFSELSGANVVLLENRPDVSEKIIQISGTPEQAEKAQSLLQGFILSIQEDGL